MSKPPIAAGAVPSFCHVSPASVDELLVAGALDAPTALAWERSVPALQGRKREIEGLAIASEVRVEALVLFRSVANGTGSSAERCRASSSRCWRSDAR